MKRTIATLLITAACLSPVIASAQTNTYPATGPGAPATVTAPPGTIGTGPGPIPENRTHEEHHHAEMHKALKHLEEAKAELQRAAHDYSGHRDQAIGLIDQAEAQIKEGIQSDRH